MTNKPMLSTKLEQAEKELADLHAEIKAAGIPPHADFWHQSLFYAEKKVEDAKQLLILRCPFCGSPASLEDHRLVWCVRCTKCSACVLGDRAPEPHGDGVSSDEVQDAQAAAMSEKTDWAAYEKSAVDAWNLRSELGAKHKGDPVAYEACGELFKTIMGARNYAGSMPIYPLFKAAKDKIHDQ